MTLAASLIKTHAHNVMGIDGSTNSLAFAMFHDGKPMRWGKINFSGNDIYEKVMDAGIKTRLLMEQYPMDYVCLESIVRVASTSVAIKMGYSLGAVMSNIMTPDTKVFSIAPLTWQCHIGNKNWTKAQKQEFGRAYPGKSASWISSEIRRRRKQFTMDYFNDRYGIDIRDDDVGDAFGVAQYALDMLIYKESNG